MDKKMKLVERKTDNSLDSPRFVLTLGQEKPRNLQISINYEVLTKLIGTNDVVINLDSSLLSLPSHQREPYAVKFLETIRALNLEYKYQKHEPRTKPSFFSVLMGNTSKAEHEIFVYIPNEIWVKDEFKNQFPDYGVRYFVLKASQDASKLLDDMQKMLDSEKLEHFRMIIFSAAVMDCMGIYTKYLTLSELKNMLEI